MNLYEKKILQNKNETFYVAINKKLLLPSHLILFVSPATTTLTTTTT